MGDNTKLNPIQKHGGDTIATDDIGGIKHQRVKVQFGRDGSATDVSPTEGLPVQWIAGHHDAFGRLRVSDPNTIFDSKQIHDNLPDLWDDAQESGADTTSVYSANAARSRIGVANNTAGKRTRQTFMRFNYQPGKSQLVILTGVLTSAANAGVTSRAGLFDDDNGLFFEVEDTTFKVAIRSNVTGSPVDTGVSQANFNEDKLDGDGDSGFNIDVAKSNIFWVDFEWLGVGDVRFGVVYHGEFIVAHTFHHENTDDVVYMSTPNLPLRYQIENDGTGDATTMDHLCSTVISEGNIQPQGKLRYKSTEGTHVACNAENTIFAVVGIRLKAAYLGAGIEIGAISMLEHRAGQQFFEWMLFFNPTVAGTFTYSDEVNSAIQTAQGATANTITNGYIMAGGYGVTAKPGGWAEAKIENAIKLGSAINGDVDTIVLAVRPIGGSSTMEIEGSIGWREFQ